MIDISSSNRSTIVALATPLGESAIGMVRLSGPEAWKIAGSLYQGKTPWEKLTVRKVFVGLFGEEGEILDEATWIRYAGPASYTGEDMVEIMFHGNPWILLEAQKKLIEHGAVMAKPGEFTERAYLNGKMDLNQAEAVNDLIRAHSRFSKSAALSQLQGKLSHVVNHLHTRLLDLLALIEAAIDHSDIEETFLPTAEISSRLSELEKGLSELLKTARAGQFLKLGIRVAIVGSPNVGKSSLFNLLAREDRAIVTNIPGTTRDILETEIQIEGIPFRLMDTAGIRESHDIVEQEGIRRTQQSIALSDVCIVLFDGQRKPSDEDRKMVELVKDKQTIFVVNKVEEPHCATMYDFLPDPILISVKHHHNIEKLHEALEKQYTSLGYNPQADILLTNQRQEMLVKQTLEAIHEAQDAVSHNASEEYIAHHLYKAKLHLEEIVGKSHHEAILERIFSQFCIGK
ncbi:tRNA uridine-5-carboxymethylaminomethyl(34) synthesis GTPase MnmE [Thermospira aquatica]|uniref:tRNA modification GTPase MnmE n=1 Tax=Thermospira aquatica TaxID=2828656 RepID=A0AAX3BEA4_9SPIR|nr:tRNA uridine-5-carboxymethylaminomethyl(34) synthesis GTPase MnmE [Thermospira aquatica]URA10678.1 tRNA uridine-5-carboxymethylaminomethyl(34) synthesis GTPase MnmE [Thermospira aquatica]